MRPGACKRWDGDVGRTEESTTEAPTPPSQHRACRGRGAETRRKVTAGYFGSVAVGCICSNSILRSVKRPFRDSWHRAEDQTATTGSSTSGDRSEGANWYR